MIRGLTQVPWERVDVSFHKSRQRYVAHNTIQASSAATWLFYYVYAGYYQHFTFWNFLFPSFRFLYFKWMGQSS